MIFNKKIVFAKYMHDHMLVITVFKEKRISKFYSTVLLFIYFSITNQYLFSIFVSGLINGSFHSIYHYIVHACVFACLLSVYLLSNFQSFMPFIFIFIYKSIFYVIYIHWS